MKNINPPLVTSSQTSSNSETALMSTSFSALPIVSLAALCSDSPTEDELSFLSARLDKVFSTTGFAYLTDLPISFGHDDVFKLCDEFFKTIPKEEKMKLAKKTFVKENENTYRGYFPPQEGADNLKEGFELGTPTNKHVTPAPADVKFSLIEPNVWPSDMPEFRSSCEKLHNELQALASRLLSLLTVSLGKPAAFFDPYLTNSLSTLRLLHYPPIPSSRQQELICTPHTDSGIMTLLHQDPTGGLEVQNSAGEWIPAPYVPGSIVVNIGDLMAKVSGGRWVATYHRVRAAKREKEEPRVRRNSGKDDIGTGKGRYSVPFFFEPGMDCVVESVEGDQVVYGKHVLEKMKQWVEFQDLVENTTNGMEAS